MNIQVFFLPLSCKDYHIEKKIRIGRNKANKINPQNISKCKPKREYEKTQSLRIS